jgi:hypothetical protein
MRGVMNWLHIGVPEGATMPRLFRNTGKQEDWIQYCPKFVPYVVDRLE